MDYNSTVDIGDSSFVDNFAVTYGGAISAYDEANITVSNSNFHSNSADGTGDSLGGAIYGNASTVITLKDSNFTDNVASHFGGAIYGQTNSTIVVENGYFHNNTAGTDGGAIRGYENSTIRVSNSNFANNSAAHYGGAIAGYANTTVVVDNSRFNNNSAVRGGAIRVDQYAVVDITESNFTDNRASEYGGALAGSNETTIVIDDSRFNNNSAVYGGAIRVDYNSTVGIRDSDFVDNFAVTYGGAISAYDEANITVSNSNFHSNSADGTGDSLGGAIYGNASTAITVKDSNFTDNVASHFGGAIYGQTNATIVAENTYFYNNTAGADGGAIRGYENSTIKLLNSNFTNNTADQYGGAVAGHANTTVIVNNSNFTNNTALYGGAIRVDYNSIVDIANSSFIDNFAVTYGGAISAYDDTSITIANSTFNANSADGTGDSYGGAIYGNASTTITVKDSNFTNNMASDYGGAIYGQTNSTIVVENTYFGNNTADNGGAIRGYENSTIKVSNSTFVNNTAKEYGGAVAGYANSTIDATDSNFINNTAQVGGAIRGDEGSVITVTGSNFENNNATERGGAIGGYTNSTIKVKNSNFTNNTADNGGAIYACAGLNVGNSSFVNNSAKSLGSAIYNIGSMTLATSNFTETNVTGYATVYLEADGDKTVSFNHNTIKSNLIPIYNDGSIIISPTKLIVLNNQTYDKRVGDTSATWAHLYDDNNNTIGSSVPVTIDVDEIQDGIVAAFDDEKSNGWNFVGTSVQLNEVGEYPVSGSYEKATHLAVFNGLLRVTAINTTVTIKIDDKKYHQEINGTVTLVDEDGNKLSETVNVTIGDKTFEVEVKDGVGTFILPYFLDAASYNATVEFAGNDHYNSSKGNTTFKITPLDTEVTVEVPDHKVGETVEGKVTLKDESGKLLNGTVNVGVDGNIVPVTVTDGEGTFEVKNQVAGSHDVSVEFAGNVNYNPSNGDNTFEVSKIATDVSVVIGNASYGEAISGTVTLVDEDNSPLTGEVVVTVDDKEYVVTVTDGTGTFDVEGPLDANNYTATVEFAETDKYLGSDNSTEFEVSKLPTVVTVEVPDHKVGETVEGKVTLKDESGNPIDGIVNVTIGNITSEVYVVNGIGNFDVLDQSAGSHNVSVEFKGNVNYLPSKGENTFDVSKIDTEVTVSVPDHKVGETVEGSVTLTDGDGNPIDGIVNVTIGDWTKEVEVVDGTGTFKVTDQEFGQHDVTVSFAGNQKYNPSNGDNTFEVSKIATDVSVVIGNASYGEAISGTVTLVDEDNSPLTGEVVVTVECKDYVVNVTDGTGTFDVEGPLDANNYTATVEFAETDKYLGSDNSTEFEVSKLPTVVTVEVPDYKYGENVTGKVTLADENGNQLSGKVNVTIGDKTIEVDVNDGNGTFDVPSVLPGNHNVTVKYAETTNYLNSTNLGQFNVAKIITKVNITIDDVPAKENVTGNVTLVDENDNPIDGTVNVTIGNTTIEVPVVNGTGNFTIPDVPTGEHNATVKFNGTDVYEGSTNTTAFNVTKIDTQVSVEVPNHNVGENVTGTVKLTDVNGNLLNGTVNVTIEDTIIEVPVVNGTGTFKVSEQVAGTHNVTVRFDGDDNYNPSTGNNTFNVTKIATNVTVTVENTTYGEPVNGTVKLTDVNGTPINATVNVTIGDVVVEVTVVNGTGNFTIPAGTLDAENYTAEVKFNETDKYLGSNNSTEFEVSKLPTKVNVTVPDHKVGENVTGTVTLTDENDTPINGTVDVIIGNTAIPVEVVNGTGTFEVPEQVAGNHNVTVKFNETTNYLNSSNLGDFNVAKIVTKVNITIDDVPAKENVTGNVTLVDENGNPIDGTVNVTIGNTTIEVPVVNGTGNFTIPDVPTGEHNATVKFNGTDVYEGSTNITDFNVTKIDTQVSVEVPNHNVGENVTGTVTLTDVNGNLLNGTVNVTIGNTTISVEVVNGTGTFDVPEEEAGTHNATVRFDGDDNYNPSTGNDTFDVTKIDTDVTITVPDIKHGENITGNVTLVDQYGNNITGVVDVTIGNITIPVEVVDGKGNFTITEIIPSGTYEPVVKFNGTNVYNPSNNVTDFVVSKNPVVENKTVIYGTTDNVTVDFAEELNETVIIEFNGKNQTVNLTDGKGTIEIPKDTKPGNYTVTVYYDDDKNVTGVVTVVPEINMWIENVPDKEVVQTGENVTFTITVGNDGPGKFNVTVSDYFDPEIYELIDFKPSQGTYDPETGIWNVGELDAGDNATLEVFVKVLTDKNITNEAVLNVVGYDYNKTAIATVEVANPTNNETNKTNNTNLLETESTLGSQSAVLLNTGNPIVALLLVLLAIPILRRKQ